MKKIIFVLAIVLIILGAWFFMQPKEMVTPDTLAPSSVSAKETKVGDRVGAFEVAKMEVSYASVTATFVGTATVNVVCSYDDMFEYICAPADEAAKQAIPSFIEFGDRKTFSVLGEGASFDLFTKNFTIFPQNPQSSESRPSESVRLRITITDYVTGFAETETFPSARLVEVVE